MSAPTITAGTSVIYGGAASGGYEEKPDVRYEETDKDGVRKVTAVISRKIHCLAVHAEAIKQSAAFPGQVVSVGGISYGAGWVVNSVSVVPDGDSAVVQIEGRREGVTPFEWELPPGLSMTAENGIARLLYTPPAGSPIEMMRFDSRMGENRYGWKVVYTQNGSISAGWGSWRGSIPVFDVSIQYEGVEQFHVAQSPDTFAPKDFNKDSRILESSNKNYLTCEAAVAAGTLVLPAFIAQLQDEVRKNKLAPQLKFFPGTFSPYTSNGTGVEVYPEEATVEAVDEEAPWGYSYKISVPCLYAVYDSAAVVDVQNRGLYWESIADTNADSPLYQHVFYRLRYAGTILLAIDITAATPPGD